LSNSMSAQAGAETTHSNPRTNLPKDFAHLVFDTFDILILLIMKR